MPAADIRENSSPHARTWNFRPIKLFTKPLGWGGILLFGYTIARDIRSLINFAIDVEGFANGYVEAFQRFGLQTTELLSWLTGSGVNSFYLALSPILLQMTFVVLLAFLAFGRETFWTRASRNSDVRPSVHYAVHLVFVLLLLHLVISYTLQLDSSAPGGQLVSLALAWPERFLDYAFALYGLVLLSILILWHPGIAIRVVGTVVLAKAVIVIVLPMYRSVLDAFWSIQ